MRHAGFPKLGRALLLIAAWPLANAEAQQYGQWSWDADVGAVRRSYDNLLGSRSAVPYDETGLALRLGINGYILHPAFAQFRAGIDATVTNYGTSRALDSRHLGFDTELRLLPQGRYPTTASFRRQAFSYSDPDAADPLGTFENPESYTRFGGRIRARGGLLRGLLVGYDHGVLDYGGSQERRTISDDVFADFARGGKSYRPHAALRYRGDDYGLVGYDVRDLTGNYDHRLLLGEAWTWNASAFAQHRSLDYRGSRSGFDNVRLGHLFQQPRGDGSLDLRYDFGLTNAAATGSQSHLLAANRRWRRGADWTLIPQVSYGLQRADGTRIQAPQLSLSAIWMRQRGRFDVTATPTAGVLFLFQGGARGSARDTSLTLDLAATAGHGGEDSLREELSASFAHNRLSRSGEGLSELPDLGARAGLGTESDLRLRLDLRRRVGTSTVAAYGEWRHAEPQGTFAFLRAGIESLTSTLQVSASRFNLTGNLGTTRSLGAITQEVRFAAASLGVRPLRLLALQGSWRRDDRELLLAPSLASDRIEGNADLYVGAFLVRGQVFRTREQATAGAERTNRGFTLTLSRRFAGWLPLVTRAFSRGVVQ